MKELPDTTLTTGEHWLIRQARTMSLGNHFAPARTALLWMFQGAVDGMASQPAFYKLSDVKEACDALNAATAIIDEREARDRAKGECK